MIFSDPTTGFGVVPAAFGYADMEQPIVFWVVFSIIGLLSSCLSALGEELGWRGFMVPTVAKVMDKKKAYVLSGIIWAVWHMPLMIAGLYAADTVMWYGLLMFVCELTIMAVIMAVIREKSNSVLPAVLIHASHNFYDQTILQSVTTDKRVPYLAGETGVLTVVIAGIILAILLWAVREKQ